MKKIFLGLFISAAIISCDKSTIQQTTDSIKHADSLFTKANNGYKTLDSISKTITDSDGIANRVIIPEIQRQKKSIDSTIKSGGWKIDSINKEIEKITKHVVVGTEVVKTLDSANDALNKGESAIKVLTRTADKILNQMKRQTPPSNPSQNNNAKSQDQNNTVIPPIVEKNPLVKTAKIEIEVEDLQTAKSLLQQKIRENNADLVTENLIQKEGFQRAYVTVKVPLQNFDQLVRNVSSQIGNLKTKEVESEGIDYVSQQMCDVEITLVQNEKLGGNTFNKDESAKTPDSFGSKSSNAFMDGFKVLGTVMIAILPFWPLFIIAGLVWYFIRRNKRRAAEKVFNNGKNVAQSETFNKEKTIENQSETEEVKTDEPTDYSKYLPKE
ncbi:DUF4349 domain-containing protein [Kaistella jeonii]|uniref:DUF4349 domain-containing protein n=1 Tax=Kaistella jeonii TaxID=266749 RepID=A0A0C1CXB2_9FLAO|nr:DUF4349 domain-containing protein [Kaistella jeonii]KIA86095.1 hypothetical protein OA86_13815 [Kaistella jeonii]SFC35225.1 protein of unknown function [Kaistella jeonii]VEI95354.1 Uncharacterised protein [Kaistella jeonii]